MATKAEDLFVEIEGLRLCYRVEGAIRRIRPC